MKAITHNAASVLQFLLQQQSTAGDKQGLQVLEAHQACNPGQTGLLCRAMHCRQPHQGHQQGAHAGGRTDFSIMSRQRSKL